MTTTIKTKIPADSELYTVKNIMTGETYKTAKSLGFEFIDGVKFTRVLHRNQIRLVRADNLKKI
jgi:hypothetical protein